MKNKGNYFTYIFVCLAAIIAIYISIKVAAKETFWIDAKLADLFTYVPDNLNPFFLLLTELGDKKGIGIVALIVLVWLLLIKRHFLGAAALTLSTALGNEVNKLLKDWIARPRPELEHLAHVDSLSFPSGHAMVGLMFYFFIAYLVIEGMKSAAAKRIGCDCNSIVTIADWCKPSHSPSPLPDRCHWRLCVWVYLGDDVHFYLHFL